MRMFCWVGSMIGIILFAVWNTQNIFGWPHLRHPVMVGIVGLALVVICGSQMIFSYDTLPLSKRDAEARIRNLQRK
jgi:hypothetical protein